MNEVKVAAVWLDATRPGWAEEIDLSILDQNDGDKCIAGQLNGATYIGDETWKDTAKELCLAVGAEFTEWDSPFGYQSGLTDAWREEVKARVPQRLLTFLGGGSDVYITHTSADLSLEGDALTISDGTDTVIIDLSMLR